MKAAGADAGRIGQRSTSTTVVGEAFEVGGEIQRHRGCRRREEGGGENGKDYQEIDPKGILNSVFCVTRKAGSGVGTGIPKNAQRTLSHRDKFIRPVAARLSVS